MAPSGDISDTFEDDSLRTSIEKADQSGQWRDPNAFADPKLEEIRKQLSEPERADYAERRRRDLQKRAAVNSAGNAAVAPGSPPPASFPSPLAFSSAPSLPPPPSPIDWRETVVKNPAVPTQPEPEPDVFAQLESKVGHDSHTSLPPETRLPLLGYVRPVLAGLSVFLPITVVLMSVGGVRFDLLVRGLLASVAAGVCWNEFRAGRIRAPLIGVGVYVLTFVTTPGKWSNAEIVANMVGFLMTLLGSGVVGFLREETKSPERSRER